MRQVGKQIEGSSDDAWQGRIVLRSPLRRMVYFGGLFGLGGLAALIIALGG